MDEEKQDIVYEKDLGLDFGFPEFDEPDEEEVESPQDEAAPIDGESFEFQEAAAPPPFSPEQVMDAPPDWSHYRQENTSVMVDSPMDEASLGNDLPAEAASRLEELESKVARLENKMDRIVSLLERISSIYGKNVSS